MSALHIIEIQMDSLLLLDIFFIQELLSAMLNSKLITYSLSHLNSPNSRPTTQIKNWWSLPRSPKKPTEMDCVQFPPIDVFGINVVGRNGNTGYSTCRSNDEM